jgi:nitroreductase
VARSVVGELVDLARWAPSAKNSQPVDWIAIDDRERIADLSARTVAALAPKEPPGDGHGSVPNRLSREHARGNDPIFYRAPVVLIAHVPCGDSFGRDHAAYAAHNVMLAAEAMGLGTCLIGYVNGALERSRPLVQLLGLPAGRRAAVFLALGYPANRFHRVAARRPSAVTWNPPSEMEDVDLEEPRT